MASVDKVKEYCLKICDYYSERVGILMRHIFRSNHSDSSIAKLAKDKDVRIAQLQSELEDNKIYENRLKELEIENI